VSPGIESVNQAWNETLGAMAEDSGTIRITATPSVAKKLLLPIIAAFRALYPDIRIDLIIDTRLTELVEAGIDIGFRSGSSPSNQLIVRKLFHTQLLICASPEYLRRHQLPKSADELFDHICTGSRQASSGRIEPWEFLTEAKEVEYRDMASPFLVNDLETEVEALLQGIGIGQIDSLNAVSHLRNGGLIPILGEHMHEHYGVFMYYAYRDLPKRTKKFVDFVLAHVGDASAFRLTDEEIGRLSVFR
jgi:DNA-binding transcriptional LysR family regulator